MNALSDQHSIEFEFENLDIAVEGLIFTEVSGVAELAANDDDDFYVKHITLQGTRRLGGIMPFSCLPRPAPSKQNLYRPNREMRTFTAHLFRAIEEALYAHQPAAEAWAAEKEDA